jgi:hypothetical protein
VVKVVEQVKWPKGSAQLVHYPASDVYAIKIHSKGSLVSHEDVGVGSLPYAQASFKNVKAQLEHVIADAVMSTIK